MPPARDILQVHSRSLDAAGGGRRWSDDRRINSADPIHHAGPIAGARALALSLNDATANRIVESLVVNLAGEGFKPRSEHPAEGTRQGLQRNWNVWTDRADADGRADFCGLLAQIVRSLVVFGEAVVVIIPDPLTGAPQLRQLHPDQLDRSWTRRLDNGGAIHQGVEFDASGRRVAYHIRRAAPGDALAGIAAAPDRIPAGDVIHIFRQLVTGQVRGLSWLTPVELLIKEVAAVTDAMVVRAKVAALHAGFITDPDGTPPYDGEQTGSTFDASLEPGAMIVLPPGKSVEFPETPDQGGAAALLTASLRMIAAGAGVTYEHATGDYSQTNYSSARGALLEFRRFCRSVQHHTLVHQFCRPVWDRFIRWQVLAGTIPALAYQRDVVAFHAVKWLPPAWDWVDPQKDAAAAEIELRNHLRSRSEIIAERGYDAEDVDREIAADQARLDRLGIAPAPAAPSTTPTPEAGP
jgi:lambda family phage portal protein